MTSPPEEGAQSTPPLLEVSDLRVSFASEEGRVEAVRGIDYRVDDGEVVGIVGESGSGKSVSSLAVLGLLPEHARVTGSIRLRGRELLGMGDRELSALRGASMSMGTTSTLAARKPARTTPDTSRRTVPGSTASIASVTASRPAPASSRAASSMSPATPLRASTQADSDPAPGVEGLVTGMIVVFADGGPAGAGRPATHAGRPRECQSRGRSGGAGYAAASPLAFTPATMMAATASTDSRSVLMMRS